jgi:hypothetical protein
MRSESLHCNRIISQISLLHILSFPGGPKYSLDISQIVSNKLILGEICIEKLTKKIYSLFQNWIDCFKWHFWHQNKTFSTISIISHAEK